jgi:prepilin-type processing-associated H-X9-DG protein
MGELGKGMIAYDMAKQHLPGFVNTINGSAGTVNVAWTVPLLPYIGRNDLWEGGTTTANPNDVGWRGGYTSDFSYIDLYVCPSDSPKTNTPLSFAVSLGSTTAAGDIAGIAANGLFRDLTNSATRTVSITDVKSRSQRPMIVENSCTNISNPTNPTIIERQWNLITLPTNVMAAWVFGFVWPPSDPTRLVVAASASSNDGTWANGAFGPTPPATGYFPPMHIGQKLNITFCDGSVRTISQTDPDDTTNPTMQCSKLDCTNLP